MGIFTWFQKKKNLPQRNIEDIKRITKILFIDDVKFEAIEKIISNGWVQCSRVKDIEQIDHPEIENTHIFFVDIQGVGKKLGFSDEGLGLARALKERYPTKSVILYSSEGQRDIFDSTLSIVDARIRKNADTYEFLKLVEKFAKQAFSLEECLTRIQKYLKQETGQSIEVSTIQINLLKVRTKDGVDIDKVVKAFGVTVKVGKIIASTITTFYSPV
jgi:DNA-binding NarL/FixJ family response regulator